MLFQYLSDINIWRKKRSEYLQYARQCRDTLVTKRGLSVDDEVVKTAVMWWVKRARRAHAIVMGREPVIDNFVAITSHGTYKGELYAE